MSEIIIPDKKRLTELKRNISKNEKDGGMVEKAYGIISRVRF
ncbi:MAG: hypothetical protein WC402_00730 [Candidatus Pacearchaeota archaeon]|jgi:hypothetical protein